MIDMIETVRAKARNATSALPLAAQVSGIAIIGDGLVAVLSWAAGLAYPRADLARYPLGPFVLGDLYWLLVLPAAVAVLIVRTRRRNDRIGATYRHARAAVLTAAVVHVTALVPLLVLALDEARHPVLLPGGDPGAVARCALALGLFVLAALERRWATSAAFAAAGVLMAGLWASAAVPVSAAASRAELLPLVGAIAAAHFLVPGLMLLAVGGSAWRRATPPPRRGLVVRAA